MYNEYRFGVREHFTHKRRRKQLPPQIWVSDVEDSTHKPGQFCCLQTQCFEFIVWELGDDVEVVHHRSTPRGISKSL